MDDDTQREYMTLRKLTETEQLDSPQLQTSKATTIGVVKKIGLQAKEIGDRYATSNPSVRKQIIDVTREFVAFAQNYLIALQNLITELDGSNDSQKLNQMHTILTSKRTDMLDSYKFLLTLLSVWDMGQSFKRVQTMRIDTKSARTSQPGHTSLPTLPKVTSVQNEIEKAQLVLQQSPPQQENGNPPSPKRNLEETSPRFLNSGQPQDHRRASTENMLGVQRRGTFRGTKRLYSHLWIVIAEGRNLPKMDVTGECDPYVVVQAGEHSCRTRTIYKERKNPFWAEEYAFEIKEPELLKNVKFTVFDSEKLGKDEVVGHISIPISSLQDQKVHEQFHPIVALSEKDYVAGDIRMSILYTIQPDGSSTVQVKIIEARNLAAKDANGFSDPYVTLKFGRTKKKTKVIKKNLNPVWEDESFTFKAPANPPNLDLLITVWDWDRVGSSDFLGQVQFDLRDVPLNNNQDSWYVLSYFNSGKDSESGGGPPTLKKGATTELKRKVLNTLANDKEEKGLGDLRVKIKFTQEMLLPLESYILLKNFLMSHLEVTTWLYDVATEKEVLGKILVNVYYEEDKVADLIDTLTWHEIKATESPDVIFRGNSLATKAVDSFMKLIGEAFLFKSLKDVIAEITKDKRSCEVDPTKLDKGENGDKNMELLKERLQHLFDSIMQSQENMPVLFRIIFSNLAKRTNEKFPGNTRVKYAAIAGFLFLRFFNPAVLGPKLFGLVDSFPAANAGRTFTLLSKTLQNLANLVNFGEKEKYMIPLNSFINEKKDDMVKYLDYASRPPSITVTKTNQVEVKIDLQKDLAGVSNFLINYKQQLKEKFAGETFSKLEVILQAIEIENK